MLQRIKRAWQRAILALGVGDQKAWDPALWNLYGAHNLTGETVTEQSALSYSAVFYAISLISGTVGSLPLHLMQQRGKSKVLATEHPLYRILHTAPNPYMNAMQLRECLMAHVLAWGNGYCEIVRNTIGDVVALWPIGPDRVKPEMDDGKLVYRVTIPNSGEQVLLPRGRVLHVAGLGFDGFLGYSVVAMARKSLGLGMAMETYGARFFGNGTHPGVIVSHPAQLSAQAHANLKQSLTDAYSGLGNAHRLMLLEDGMKVEKISIPNNDSQFLESRQFQIPEVARWFNLPPHKLKDLSKSSFNNIESEQISFVTDSILPWLIRCEQSFQQQLLTPSEQKRGLYFKHIVEGLLRGDAKSRGEFYASMFMIGGMSINEIREKEDLDPIDGGDIHLVPMNMVTVENAGKPAAEEPAAPVPGATEPGATAKVKALVWGKSQ